VVAKHTGEEPFAAPKALLEAVAAKKFGPYVDPTLGEVPVDFLADLDITGGNSGSATLNAKGELTGLVFDGNIEAMASDWVFMPEITRSIHVDIRYVLWVMDAVDNADHLLTEMGVHAGDLIASLGRSGRMTMRMMVIVGVIERAMGCAHAGVTAGICHHEGLAHARAARSSGRCFAALAPSLWIRGPRMPQTLARKVRVTRVRRPCRALLSPWRREPASRLMRARPPHPRPSRTTTPAHECLACADTQTPNSRG
jgi:hypothetical protein